MVDNLPDNVTHCASSLDDIHVSNQDVIDVIQNLKPNKACGFDQISHISLIESLSILALPISTLFNKSLNLGQFPDNWKMANVLSVFKGKDPSIVSNYRPISLLSCLGKVSERCIFKHLFNYLRGNNLISINQSGFTPGDSTTNLLVSICLDVCTSLDNQRDIQLIFFDISKAFDKVWHMGLLFKLETIGIKGNLLSWFHNYLSNRKQRIVLNGKTSSWKFVNAGVPQGSVLGPLMFLIYINDISLNLSCKTSLFADDTSLSKQITNRQVCELELQNDLKTIETSAEKWKVTFNPQKSDALLVSRKVNRNNKTHFLFQGH